jgi:hypothetical protein
MESTMRRTILLGLLAASLTAVSAAAQVNYIPPAPPVLPPPPYQPAPQVQPPAIAIPSEPVRPTPSKGFHPYPKMGRAAAPVARRKGYGDRVVPCIQRGRTYGLDDREMNAHIARCAN